MKNILTIGHHDVKTLLRDPTSFIWLLLMPLAFVYFMSFSSRPPSEPRDEHPRVWVENKDSGYLASMLIRELEHQGLWMISETEKSRALREITIPEDFTASVLAKQQSKIGLSPESAGGTNQLKASLVEAQLIRAILSMNSLLVEHATKTGAAPLTEDALIGLRAIPNPVQLESRFAGRNPIPVGFNMSLPGVLVMYLLMNLLIFGGAGIAQDRRSGVLRRMSHHPISPAELLYGKLYGLMLLGVFQIVFFLALGQWVFGVNIGDQLLGITLTLLLFAWVAASIGLLIGFLIRSEDKVIGMALLIALPLAAFGGCWWPMELVSESVRVYTLFTPTAWAMQSLHQLITYGAGIDAVVTPLLVLTAFGLVANFLAARFYRT